MIKTANWYINRVAGTNPMKREILEYYLLAHELEDGIEKMKETVEHGCISGIATPMIYYKDTKEFFYKYEDEIEEYIELYELQVMPKVNISNALSWFAWELATFEMIEELERLIEDEK